MHSVLIVALLIVFFLFDLIIFALAGVFFGIPRFGVAFPGVFAQSSCLKSLISVDANTFRPVMFHTSPKGSSLFLPHVSPHVDVYFTPRKRSRITAPFVGSRQPNPRLSIEALPDECLFEILRRLAGAQERSSCASVSKRWLTLLSTIQRDELKENDSVEPQIQSDDSNGYLSRCLEGKKATDVRLAAISVGTANRGGLGKLSIRGSDSTRGLTNAGLKAVARGCPGLRALSLWNLSSVGDDGLREIATGCRFLEKIDLSHCPAITDKGLIAIAMNCPNLKSVTLESCLNIGDEALRSLGHYCPNLKCITVTNCPLIGDRGIGGLFSSAGHILEKAKFEALNISDISLAVLGHYGSAMTDLSLVGLKNVNERGFWVMGKGQGLKKLKSLSISCCGGVSDSGVEALGKGCQDLKTFSLRKCSLVSDRGLVSFAKGAESLESLQLDECHGITQRGVFNILANCCKKLKALALTNCLGVRDSDFLEFPFTSLCLSLRSLTIRSCPGFGDVSLGLLGRLCPKLTQVDLTGIKGVTDAGVSRLVQCSEAGLAKLNLSGCLNLTDKTVEAIVELHGETLKVLNLDGCGYITDMSLIAIARNCGVITELDVSRCGISNSGIEALAAAEQTSLQILSVGGCGLVSDKSVPFLVALGKTLVGLNVKHCCGVTSGAIDLLIDQLWRCDVLY
ncbi:Transcription factor COE2 [Castilleja foliolosa]|uniref:Transcription factor COE2 n=1 Tax=Castilleja foliolosa TaxID=1961234 RepID=A0ABD3DVV4_9LAMI